MKRWALIVMMTAMSANAQLRTYSFEQASELSNPSSRPIVVFLQAEWCRICKMMQKTTFEDPEVIRLMNEHFVFVPFSVEEKHDIRFDGRTFRYIPRGVGLGAHELTGYLLGEAPEVFPTLIILDDDYQARVRVQTYLDAASMKNLLWEVLKNQ